VNPFANESETLDIADLTIENRVDHISLFGSLDITRDKIGLAKAKALYSLLGQAINVLESIDLPEKIDLEKGDRIRNPFT